MARDSNEQGAYGGRPRVPRWRSFATRGAGVCAVLLAAMAIGPHSAVTVVQAQDTPEATADRISERIAALQREAEQLARQAKTLIGDLRKLEVERDLRLAEARKAEADAAAAQEALDESTRRIADLEQQRVSELPVIKAQLVDLYKRGRGRYAQLLLDARSFREFARAARTVAALAALNERRLADHQRLLQTVQQERGRLEGTARALEAHRVEARRASAAADRAVTARAALMADIDSRRDLTAQYVGELQVAYERLQAQIQQGGDAKGGEASALPLAPFRGALPWPASGRIVGSFGQADRPGDAITRNGIEIAAAEGASVQAVHGGTVGFADVFSGLGSLVIVDHGSNNFSLYGYLGVIGVARGDKVDAGTELGRVGVAPSGTPGLYFEMRIDGGSVNPVQWLQPR